jgi:CoA:oxalate CoA-transferase
LRGEIKGPLNGIRVVDLTRVYSGPYATFLMALAGAEVLKIEPPEGESLRRRDGRVGSAVPFAMLNANKRALTLNLKDVAGKHLLTQLLSKADVLVENFRPGVMERLGFDKRALHRINEKLICGSISGFGQDGPYRDYPAMDLTVQAFTGIIASTGWQEGPPVKAGAAVADIAAGTHLYAGVVSALFHRERTGEVIHPEIAMTDSIYPTLCSNLGLALGSDHYVERTGNRHAGLSLCPYNVYPASDGYVAIICNGDAHWRALVNCLRLADLGANPEFATVAGRVAQMDFIDRRIGETTCHFDKETLFQRLNRAGVACGPVRSLPEVLRDPQMLHSGMLQEIDHPQYGRLVLSHSPLTFAGEPRFPYRPSPPLGSDNVAIYCDELGVSRDELEAMRTRKVV